MSLVQLLIGTSSSAIRLNNVKYNMWLGSAIYYFCGKEMALGVFDIGKVPHVASLIFIE